MHNALGVDLHLRSKVINAFKRYIQAKSNFWQHGNSVTFTEELSSDSINMPISFEMLVKRSCRYIPLKSRRRALSLLARVARCCEQRVCNGTIISLSALRAMRNAWCVLAGFAHANKSACCCRCWKKLQIDLCAPPPPLAPPTLNEKNNSLGWLISAERALAYSAICFGELQGDNQLIYRSAFCGSDLLFYYSLKYSSWAHRVDA